MRMAVPYGLERFWGEHSTIAGTRLLMNAKRDFGKVPGTHLVKVMDEAGVTIPNDEVNS